MPEITRALFVAWQNPETRRFYPVGRLAQVTGDTCDDCFEFVYIAAAREAEQQGFLPFLSFPELEELYRGRELFPMFANRILPTSRPDFSEYLEQLGLPPATSSPVQILSRSGGRRATDTLRALPVAGLRTLRRLPHLVLGPCHQAPERDGPSKDRSTSSR